MERKRFEEILEICKNNIIEVGIKKGYFRLEDKQVLEDKLRVILDNGIDLELTGDAVYGYYQSRGKKLHYNPGVYKDEQEAMIYILHEMKHGLDDSGYRIGFQENQSNPYMMYDYPFSFVGANEGATQRFAIDMTEEILGERIPQTQQKSLGIELTTNLDEYQIEDKMNDLMCRALKITKEEFMRAQNEPKQETRNSWSKMFGIKNFMRFQTALDKIYYIRETTFLDENKHPLAKPRELNEEEVESVKVQIKICQDEIRQYVERTNPDRFDEIEKEMIPIDESVRIPGDNVEYEENESFEIMSESELLNQDLYMEYQNFVTDNLKLDLGDSAILLVEWCSGLEREAYGNFEEALNESDREYYEIIFVRQGEEYKKIKFSFDKSGVIDVGQPEEIEDFDEIKETIESEQWLGNPEEYIRFLKSRGLDLDAEIVQKKYEYFMKNKDRIPEIRKRIRQESSENSAIDEIAMLADCLYYGDDENIIISEDGRIIIPGKEQTEDNPASNFTEFEDQESEYEDIKYKAYIINRYSVCDIFGKLVSLDENGHNNGLLEKIVLELEKAVESGEVVLTEAQKNTLSIYVKPKVDEKDFAKVAGKSIEEKDKVQKTMKVLAANREENTTEVNAKKKQGE